jgi:hypothetical protein
MLAPKTNQQRRDSGLIVRRGPTGSAILLEARLLLRLAAVLAVALLLSGCAKSYRYKLTLAVNTPDGVKRASSVGEVSFQRVYFPERGTFSHLRGEALYLDLGSGAKPLIALLTNRIREYYGWSKSAGPRLELLSDLYNVAASTDYMDTVSKIASQRGPHKIEPDQLPDLVTFTNIDDPRSVILVDPDHLQATLGPSFTWNEITIEITDDPVSTGIEQKLPWIPYYVCGKLDGDHGPRAETLASRVTTADFRLGTSSEKPANPCYPGPREWQQRLR